MGAPATAPQSMDKLKDEYEKMKNQYNLDGDAEQKENKKKLDFLINKVLTLLQETGKEEAEFQRLMKLPEFRQAMATGTNTIGPRKSLCARLLRWRRSSLARVTCRMRTRPVPLWRWSSHRLGPIGCKVMCEDVR